MELQDLINKLPSNVSGDGKNFVSGLKKILSYIDSSTGEEIETAIASIGEGNVEQVTNLTLTEYHTTDANGSVNNVQVAWDNTNVTDYSYAQAWYRIGEDGTWTQKGNSSGTQYNIEGLTTGVTYYFKVVACNKSAGSATFSEAPTANITIKGSILICNTPTQFYWSNDDSKWHWSGYVDNGYTDLFEIRLDTNAGVWNEYRLDQVQAGTYESSVPPTSRSGTAYLYVRNVFGTYNTPATHVYNVTAPTKPNAPTLAGTVDGVVITMDALPTGCTNYIVVVGDEEFEVYTQQWTYHQFSGSVTIKYCFVDEQGRGEFSESTTADVGRLLKEADIDDSAITADKIATNAVTSAKIYANAITADKIASSAVTTEKLNAGAVTAAKITSGTITATQLASNCITSDKISANAVHASHLYGETISLSTSLKIAAGAVVLDSSGLTITEDDGGFAIFDGNGVTFKDKNGYVFANVGRQLIGYNVAHGKYVAFAHAWDTVPHVICIPRNLDLTSSGWSSSDISMACYAYNISTSGFYVMCKNTLAAGAKVITTTSDSFSTLIDLGMTDDYHHYYDGEDGHSGTTTYPAINRKTESKLSYYSQTKTYTKPVDATAITINFSWQAVSGEAGAVYPRVYIQNASGETVATYTGYDVTPIEGSSGYDSTTYGATSVSLSGNLPASDTSFKVFVEICYNRYHNAEDPSYISLCSLDSYEITNSSATEIATGYVDFIACEVNESSYS